MTVTDELERAIDAAVVAANVRRVRLVAPILIVVHAIWAIVFANLHAASAAEASWQRGLVSIHAAGAAITAAFFVLATRFEGRPAADALRRRLGTFVSLYGFGLGTIIVLNSLQYHFTLAAWMLTALIGAVTVYVRLGTAIAIQAASFAIVLAASLESTSDTSLQLGLVANASALGGMAFVLSRVLMAAFVREVIARGELVALNRELERRVAAQVTEIVANADRIDVLNRQLSEQVRIRSEALSAALERVAAAEHGEDTLAIGTVVADRFEIRHLLGVGGMGVVYAAFDRLARAPVALKIVHHSIAGVSAGHRFLQEVNAAAQLSHPAIVRVLHVDVTSEGRLFQVQELVDGHALDAWTDLDRALPAPMVARLGAAIADALATAHAADIVHRDVKPENVMLTHEAPGCRLLDFGLAKLRRALVAPRLSESGTVVGTPQFLAPEQIAAPASVTGAADVYALGMVMYRCVSGAYPFDATAPLTWMHAHTYVTPRPVPASAAPPRLAATIMACLAKAPVDRPDARALAATLGAIADELGADPLERWVARTDHGETRRLIGPASPAPRRAS